VPPRPSAQIEEIGENQLALTGVDTEYEHESTRERIMTSSVESVSDSSDDG